MLLVLLNAHHEPLPFTLPAHKRSVRWQMILDTAATKHGKKQCTMLRGGTPYNLHARARVSSARRDPGRNDTGHLRIHEVFYNRRRRPSTLGYYSPAEFEARTAVA